MTRSLTINRLALPKVRIDCHKCRNSSIHLCSINATCLIYTFDAKTGRADSCKAQSIYKSPYHSQFCERVSMIDLTQTLKLQKIKINFMLLIMTTWNSTLQIYTNQDFMSIKLIRTQKIAWWWSLRHGISF